MDNCWSKPVKTDLDTTSSRFRPQPITNAIGGAHHFQQVGKQLLCQKSVGSHPRRMGGTKVRFQGLVELQPLGLSRWQIVVERRKHFAEISRFNCLTRMPFQSERPIGLILRFVQFSHLLGRLTK